MSKISIAERTTAVDAAFEQTRAILLSEDAQTELGHQATLLANAASNYFVPNRRDGVWQVPKSYAETDKLPVIPVLWGEKIKYDNESFSYLSPARREKLTREIGALPIRHDSSVVEIVNRAEELMQEMPYAHTKIPSPVEAEIRSAGYNVITPGIFEDDRRDLSFLGNPYLHVVIDSPITPSVIAHELVHKKQYDDESIIIGLDESLPNDTKELEAYEVGATIERLIGQIGVQSCVEQARRRYADPGQPYSATRALRWQLYRKGLFTVAKSFK